MTDPRLQRLPGTGIRFGFDSLIGVIPVVGDTITLVPSAYILMQAHKSGASKGLLARMGANIGIDWLIGLVPLIGDLFDVGWKSNIRNAALLRTHVENTTPPNKRAAPLQARPSQSSV